MKKLILATLFICIGVITSKYIHHKRDYAIETEAVLMGKAIASKEICPRIIRPWGGEFHRRNIFIRSKETYQNTARDAEKEERARLQRLQPLSDNQKAIYCQKIRKIVEENGF